MQTHRDTPGLECRGSWIHTAAERNSHSTRFKTEAAASSPQENQKYLWQAHTLTKRQTKCKTRSIRFTCWRTEAMKNKKMFIFSLTLSLMAPPAPSTTRRHTAHQTFTHSELSITQTCWLVQRTSGQGWNLDAMWGNMTEQKSKKRKWTISAYTLFSLCYITRDIQMWISFIKSEQKLKKKLNSTKKAVFLFYLIYIFLSCSRKQIIVCCGHLWQPLVLVLDRVMNKRA